MLVLEEVVEVYNVKMYNLRCWQVPCACQLFIHSFSQQALSVSYVCMLCTKFELDPKNKTQSDGDMG